MDYSADTPVTHRAYKNKNYLKSYTTLSLAKEPMAGLPEGLGDTFRALVGLFLLGKYQLEELNRFATNRYFANALGISGLVSESAIRNSLERDGAKLRQLAAELSKKAKSKNEIYEKDFQLEISPKAPFFETLKSIHQYASCLLQSFIDQGLTGEISSERSLFSAEAKAYLDKNGYVVIPNVLTANECDELRDLTLRMAAAERKMGVSYRYGFGENCQRIYNLLNKHEKYRALIQRLVVLEIMESMFARDTLHDKYVLSSWHCNIIGPGGEASILHVDSAVPEPLPPWIIRANVNFMLDDYTEENGATQCLPGSHKFLKKPSDADQTRKDLVNLTGAKGSLAIWNGHLWHRSGTNRTKKDRVALLGCFAASHLKEMSLEEDHLRIIDEETVAKMSPVLQRWIGVHHGLKDGALAKHDLL